MTPAAQVGVFASGGFAGERLMRLAVALTRASEGVVAPLVTVEVHLSGGLPGTSKPFAAAHWTRSPPSCSGRSYRTAGRAAGRRRSACARSSHAAPELRLLVRPFKCRQQGTPTRNRLIDRIEISGTHLALAAHRAVATFSPAAQDALHHRRAQSGMTRLERRCFRRAFGQTPRCLPLKGV